MKKIVTTNDSKPPLFPRPSVESVKAEVHRWLVLICARDIAGLQREVDCDLKKMLSSIERVDKDRRHLDPIEDLEPERQELAEAIELCRERAYKAANKAKKVFNSFYTKNVTTNKMRNAVADFQKTHGDIILDLLVAEIKTTSAYVRYKEAGPVWNSHIRDLEKELERRPSPEDIVKLQKRLEVLQQQLQARESEMGDSIPAQFTRDDVTTKVYVEYFGLTDQAVRDHLDDLEMRCRINQPGPKTGIYPSRIRYDDGRKGQWKLCSEDAQTAFRYIRDNSRKK